MLTAGDVASFEADGFVTVDSRLFVYCWDEVGLRVLV